MAKRMLTKDERRMNEKSIARLKEECTHCKFLIEHANMMIDTGYISNAKASIRAAKATKAKDDADYEQNTATIKILEDQLKSGVEEVKPEKDKDDDGKESDTE